MLYHGCCIGNWELQLETILECCNEAYPRRSLQESQSNKRVKLSEPLPFTKSMCQVKILGNSLILITSGSNKKIHVPYLLQKLDDLCLENNWVLPTYRVSSTDGNDLSSYVKFMLLIQNLLWMLLLCPIQVGMKLK